MTCSTTPPTSQPYSYTTVTRGTRKARPSLGEGIDIKLSYQLQERDKSVASRSAQTINRQEPRKGAGGVRYSTSKQPKPRDDTATSAPAAGPALCTQPHRNNKHTSTTHHAGRLRTGLGLGQALQPLLVALEESVLVEHVPACIAIIASDNSSSTTTNVNTCAIPATTP